MQLNNKYYSLFLLILIISISPVKSQNQDWDITEGHKVEYSRSVEGEIPENFSLYVQNSSTSLFVEVISLSEVTDNQRFWEQSLNFNSNPYIEYRIEINSIRFETSNGTSIIPFFLPSEVDSENFDTIENVSNMNIPRDDDYTGEFFINYEVLIDGFLFSVDLDYDRRYDALINLNIEFSEGGIQVGSLTLNYIGEANKGQSFGLDIGTFVSIVVITIIVGSVIRFVVIKSRKDRSD